MFVGGCSHREAGGFEESNGAGPIEARDEPASELFYEPDEEDAAAFPEEVEERPPFAMTPEFCAHWNPEFFRRGRRCCARTSRRGFRIPKECDPKRRGTNLCGETVDAQRLLSGEHLDVLERAWQARGDAPDLGSPQAMCSVDNGFLAHGVPLVPTASNRIEMNNPWRCANYGTTGLVLMLHRLGKAVATHFQGLREYDGVRLIVGDLSAPRGGCLPTRRGAHSGHTNGLDADLAFLEAKAGRGSNRIFQKRMDAEQNWWLLKAMADVSPVCLQYIFVDRSHIKALRQVASDDPAWPRFQRLLKHISGHRNHFHVRVGVHPRVKDEFLCRVLAAPAAKTAVTPPTPPDSLQPAPQ